MNPDQREHLRTSILQVMEANGTRYGLGIRAIRGLLVIYSVRPTDAEITTELDYLRDKTLVEPMNKTISPENSAWRITAEGRDWLAVSGF